MVLLEGAMKLKFALFTPSKIRFCTASFFCPKCLFFSHFWAKTMDYSQGFQSNSLRTHNCHSIPLYSTYQAIED